ncbi:sodium/proton antiporter [Lachnospiraceae bacterium KM106-2]|nr:sodium/proton antiporter [Lachnospiraceae bacterium KM106-2]
MSKLRKSSADSKWCRFVNWVNGTVEENKKEESAKDQISVEEVAATVEKQSSLIDKVGNLEGETALNQRLDQFQEKGMRFFHGSNKVMSVMICLIVVGVLLYTVSFLPEFGDASSPINNEVSERYITKGIQETGAVNIVTGMILDYRAFDTFGESHVLYVAACVVLILLRLDVKSKAAKKDENDELSVEESEANDRIYEPKNDVILQKVATCLVPPIMIFGIYVILNGHLSPGGGFSGGAIIGAGLILYLNAFGFKKTGRFFTMNTFKTVTFLSLVGYAMSKSYSFFTGANHIHSIIPLGTPGDILSSGLILPLNIFVGLVVACTMYGFYALFRKGGM